MNMVGLLIQLKIYFSYVFYLLFVMDSVKLIFRIYHLVKIILSQ